MPRRVSGLFPVAGLLLGSALLVVAALDYPGGYRWSEHTISELLAPTTPTGAVNSSRLLAMSGAFIVLAGMAWLFHLLSSSMRPGIHRSVFQIGGIGSMVYAALLAVLHVLSTQHRWWLFGLGVVVLATKPSSAVILYGEVAVAWLPLRQKVSTVWTAAWLVLVQLRLGRAVDDADRA